MGLLSTAIGKNEIKIKKTLDGAGNTGLCELGQGPGGDCTSDPHSG